MPRACYSLNLPAGRAVVARGENVHGDQDASKQKGNSLVPNVNRLPGPLRSRYVLCAYTVHVQNTEVERLRMCTWGTSVTCGGVKEEGVS